jgi:hypothetical protein
MPTKDTNPNNNINDQKLEFDAVLSELVTIKQLLAILLAKLGSDSGEIGEALRVDPRRIRDWISFNGIERIPERSEKKVDKGKKRSSDKTDNGKRFSSIEERAENSSFTEPVDET